MVSLVVRVWWCCCGVLCCLGGWWGPLVDVVISMRWVRWRVALLFLPLVGGLVGCAGGVCSPAVVVSWVVSSIGAP